MSPKKIFFLISSLSFGGAQKQTIALLNGLDPQEIRASVGYIIKRDDLLPEINRENIEGIYCFNKRHRLDIAVIKRVRKTLRDTKPDIVVCVDPYPLLIARLALMFSKSPCSVVNVIHMTKMRNSYIELAVRILYRTLINGVDQLIFVSHNQKEYWLDHFKIKNKNIHVIHNGIDLDYFSCTASNRLTERSDLGVSDDEFLFCTCAVLRPEKQLTDLIHAAAILQKQGFPVKILIVGDGPERDKIVTCIKSYDLSSYVKMIGFRKDVRPYIALSDVFVLTSTSETFSMAILEAMALGKPIIASDTGGVKEQVQNNVNGLLYQPGDVNGLAESMKKMMNKKMIEKMGRHSLNKVTNDFSESKMVEKYASLFSRM